MKDTRYVYGVGCTWSGPIQKVGNTGPQSMKINGRKIESAGLPCCPHCKGLLMECINREQFLSGAVDYEKDHPGYLKLFEWSEGKCFRGFLSLTLAYNEATGADYPLPEGIKNAKLIAHNTADGASFIHDHVPLGKLYIVNVDSISDKSYCDLENGGKVTVRKSIEVLQDDQKSWGIMPLELISIDK